MKRNAVFILYTIALVVVVAIVASGVTLLGIHARNLAQGDMVTITKQQYAQLQGYKRLSELEVYIDQVFYQDMESQPLLDGAAKGMVAALGDPYSRYYTPAETEIIQQAEKGEYAGIGVVFLMDRDDGLLTAQRIYADSPAEEAGVQMGDKVTHVDGESVDGLDQSEIVQRIRGEENTQVEMTLLRGEESVTLMLTRRIVTINRVSVRMLEGGIGLIRIDEFEGDVVKGFKSALDTLKSEKANGMIVDLRGNPGGNLEMVVDICDMILPKGAIVSMQNKQGETRVFESDASMVSYPMVILVNQGSASASEIMAAAVQDYALGTIVGVQTYGKGVVQSYYILKEDNASLTLTSAEYFTPSGRSIHGTGVTPDIVVEMPENGAISLQEASDPNDAQLLSAIAALQQAMEAKEAS